MPIQLKGVVMTHSPSMVLLTDLYQLTMAYGYWKSGMVDQEAVFHLLFRRLPFKGGFAVAAGLQQVIDFLRDFHFDSSDLDYLATLTNSSGSALFDEGFLAYLRELKLEVEVDAIPEGTIVFPQEPLIRVKGPLIQAQLLESALLNMINFQTLIATKAARVKLAAGEDEVLEFGLRRAQGIDGALSASRAAYIGGCDATSNVLAGKRYGIPVRGTHAHSWVMAFGDEMDSFATYARAMPDNCIFLVDTYDTLTGVDRAIEIGKWLREQGKPLLGIRLDSGDLAYLSKEARKRLDAAGFSETKIVASNELDEVLIGDLKRQGAKITVWGVGTNLVTARDQPALDGVYKLAAIRRRGEEWKYSLKLSEQLAKISNPGLLQVKRFGDDSGFRADVIYDELQAEPPFWTVVDPLDSTRSLDLSHSYEQKELLRPVVRDGEVCFEEESLETIRQRLQKELGSFHEGIKRFLNPHQYVVGLERGLYDKKMSLIHKIRHSKRTHLSAGDS